MLHQPAREGIEAYLAGKPDANFISHIESCAECRETVFQLEFHSTLLRDLRAPADLEPPPGFYARVLERIDSQRSFSIWSVFLEPLFARRLMYASAVLTILLGVFLFTSPKDDFTATSMPERILAEENHPPAQLVDLEQDRNTVLVQLTTYEE